jgi:2-polyprenyl-3-methyl-5-hydroxy-6-metoxy-1,4-benzoquinol methylase
MKSEKIQNETPNLIETVPIETVSLPDALPASDAPLSYMEDLWSKIGENALTDFRTVAISRKALSLVGNKQGRILDVGCGAGVFTMNALKLGYSVTGLDVSEAQIETSRKIFASVGLPTDVLRCAGLETLAAEGERFEAAVALDVVEHVEARVAFLTGMRRVLKSGGRAVVSVPAGPELYDGRDRRSGHYLRYDPPTLRREMLEAGFRIETLGYWNALGWLHRKLSPAKSEGQTYEFRYSRSWKARLFNAALRQYFLRLENRVSPPVGLSLVAVGVNP